VVETLRVRAQIATLLVKYRYDGLNRRIAKLIPNGETNWDRTDYYYNTSWQCLEERAQTVASDTAVATAVKVQYVWDIRYIDAPVLRWRDTGGASDLDETLYYCQDANMNVTALVDGTTGSGTFGDVVERVLYDPYGKPKFYDGDWDNASDDSAYANEILYCGYRRDPETGLYHVRHRAYHPTLGRWLQRDPIRYADDMSLYGYVRSAPVGLHDPLGLEGTKVFGYRAITWDDFTSQAIEGFAMAEIVTGFDESLGELAKVACTCVADTYCGGSKPAAGSKCYQCFTWWSICSRINAVMDPTTSRKDLSTHKLGGADAGTSEYALGHEQGHFRNTEAVARLANTELQTDCNAVIAYYFWGEWAAPTNAARERWKIVDEIITRAHQRKESLNTTYDSAAETDHGRNKTLQGKWNEYFKSDPGFTTWAPPWSK
jgi:RHS repeat-associated protein